MSAINQGLAFDVRRQAASSGWSASSDADPSRSHSGRRSRLPHIGVRLVQLNGREDEPIFETPGIGTQMYFVWGGRRNWELQASAIPVPYDHLISSDVQSHKCTVVVH